MLMKSQL